MARVFIDIADLETAVEVREAVQADGHDVEMVEKGREAENRLREEEDEIALVLTGDPDGDDARGMWRIFDARIPRPPILTFRPEEDGGDGEWSGEREGRGEALRTDEWLSRPADPQEVRVVLNQQMERFRLQRETGIIGRTRAIRDVLERIHLVAPVNSTVLLTGESGTGKELVARAIHRYSPRRGRSFIAVNCAALPESLLESELFGHEKGAFTGATSRRRGMFELADGGTIFLDEIAEMPPPTQTRLLRVLEQRRFMRVGGDEEIEVNVRVVAATNQDLRYAVQAGDFRRDLYYRLNVLHMDLPALRYRKADIPVLVRRFIGQLTESHGRDFKGLTPDAMELLLEYDWPGNVRELRNLVESMVVLAPGAVIRAEDIPEEIRTGRGRAMLPARSGGLPERVRVEGEDGDLPRERSREMEFIFRTLIDLRMDVEDLRREFERYRRNHPELVEGEGRRTAIEVSAVPERHEAGAGGRPGEPPRDGPAGAPRDDASSAASETDRDGGDAADDSDGTGDAEGIVDGEEIDDDPGTEESPAITFQPGMSMSELEREAIVATLKDVDGNRRRAAEKLGIGERTLYRKLREYDIDL